MFNGGNAPPGTVITVNLNNIVNPGASGQAADYEIRTTDGSGTTGIIDVTGSVFGSTSIPTVVNLIPNQSIKEEAGSIVVDLDSGAAVNNNLNYTFEDGDGDPLTFSIDPGHNTGVVTASIINDELLITGQGTGTTTLTIRASDGIDGSITDSFDVSVVGDLIPASVTPSSFFTGNQADYTIMFSPATNLTSGDFIIFSTQIGGPDQSNSTIKELSGSTLTGSITSGSGTSTVVMFNAGSATPADTIKLVLSNILNPSTVGLSPNYDVRTTDGGSPTGISTVSGHNFSTAPELIYENGFESATVVLTQTKIILDEITKQATNQSIIVPYIEHSTNRIIFHGKFLDLVQFSHKKSLFDLIIWLEDVLDTENPDGDYDGDGIDNIHDELPFNI